MRSKRGHITIDPKLIKTTTISVALLVVYAIFEGFESEDPVFITLRAISLSLFIIVPVFFILVNNVGLQRLMVIQEGGVPIIGYKFPSNTFISMDSTESKDFILAAGFLSAISSFSDDILKAGSSISIRSKQLYFILTHTGGNIYALQALHTNRELEKILYNFGENLNLKLPKTNNLNEIDLDMVKSEVHNSFSSFY